MSFISSLDGGAARRNSRRTTGDSADIGPAPRAPERSTRGGSSQPEQSERDRRRQGLHEEDPPVCRRRAVETGDQHADEEEDLDAPARRTEPETPEEPGGEEAVVEALVGRQHARGRRRL